MSGCLLVVSSLVLPLLLLGSAVATTGCFALAIGVLISSSVSCSKSSGVISFRLSATRFSNLYGGRLLFSCVSSEEAALAKSLLSSPGIEEIERSTLSVAVDTTSLSDAGVSLEPEFPSADESVVDQCCVEGICSLCCNLASLFLAETLPESDSEPSLSASTAA